ncbi:hypothetical protein JHK85_050623 [Glycine max]|nr:hypothetical protein JHK86_049858 [Glycine max]KAG4935704.1 hypothetical protein JHK85_050623 [Glycine max]
MLHFVQLIIKCVRLYTLLAPMVLYQGRVTLDTLSPQSRQGSFSCGSKVVSRDAVGSSTYPFFDFNIWRILALNEAGGWKDRTTLEDMNLVVRANAYVDSLYIIYDKFEYLIRMKLTSTECCYCQTISHNKHDKSQHFLFSHLTLNIYTTLFLVL